MPLRLRQEVQTLPRPRLIVATRTVRVAFGALALVFGALPALAQAVVQDVPTGSGSKRVLFVSPASPRAIGR